MVQVYSFSNKGDLALKTATKGLLQITRLKKSEILKIRYIFVVRVLPAVLRRCFVGILMNSNPL